MRTSISDLLGVALLVLWSAGCHPLGPRAEPVRPIQPRPQAHCEWTVGAGRRTIVREFRTQGFRDGDLCATLWLRDLPTRAGGDR